jgi:hypothetical protein
VGVHSEEAEWPESVANFAVGRGIDDNPEHCVDLDDF